MKLIIAGGRNYKFTAEDLDRLYKLRRLVSEVVSGGATGADAEGEEWARACNLPITRYPADWNRYGNRAGPIRNFQMAKYADAVALFPGGKGTQDMHNQALKHGLKIYDFR